MKLTKNQKAVFDYILKYSEDNGDTPTQREIKEYFGLKSYGSVQRYLNYLIDAGLLLKDWNKRRGLELCGPKLSPDLAPELTRGLSSNSGNSGIGPNSNSSLIPMLGKIAAGIPIEAIENPPDTLEMLDIPPHLLSRRGGPHYALEVVGESMIELGIMSGDTAIIRHQQTANSGEIVVALIDGDATLKTYIPSPDKIEFRPANSTMSSIIIPKSSSSSSWEMINQDVKIAGVLTGIMRKFGA